MPSIYTVCTYTHASVTFSRCTRLPCAGTRYYMRGLDLDGHAANYVETEQLVIHNKNKASFVQVSGSCLEWFTAYVRTYVCVRVDTFVCMYICIPHTRTHAHTHAHTHTHTHTHTTHTHTYTCTHSKNIWHAIFIYQIVSFIIFHLLTL